MLIEKKGEVGLRRGASGEGLRGGDWRVCMADAAGAVEKSFDENEENVQPQQLTAAVVAVGDFSRFW